MPRKPLDELGDLQRTVVEILWKLEEATVHDVRDAIRRPDGKKPAYTTVLSVLQKLEKAGWVGHRKDGRTHVYAPCQTREEEGSHSVRSFVERVFSGDRKLLFQHLINDGAIDARDLSDLRQMIDARREELNDEG